MNIVRCRAGDVLILKMQGRITIEGGDREAGRSVRQALESGDRKILIDLGEVPMVDSAGLGELVSVFAWAHRRHATMKLLRLSVRVRELLAVCRMTAVFDTFEDEATAVASFG